jgi:hypothetical protein
MPAPVRTAAASLRVLLDGMIDYAGLFPPASLDMKTCVQNCRRYRNTPEQWALGRFVLPVGRLDEFLIARRDAPLDRWRLSGIVSTDIATDLSAVEEFNRKASNAVMDSLEVRVRCKEDILLAAQHLPPGAMAFFEIAPERAAELLPVVREVGGSAKLRTGGVVAEAFPTVEQIAGFIAVCAELGVPFKATAGLHHPMRSVRPLTYEPDSRAERMHGFLNLFTSAAIAWSAARAGRDAGRTTLATCLADEERANWHFDEDALTWSGENEPRRMDLKALRATRTEFALSFGSCSFEEPLADLHELDLL